MTDASYIQSQVERLKLRRDTLLPALVAVSQEAISHRQQRRLCALIKALQEGENPDGMNSGPETKPEKSNTVNLRWLPYVSPLPVLASTDDQERGLDDSRRYDCDAVQHEHDLLIRIIDAAEDGKSQFVRISMFAYPTTVLAVSLGVLVLLCISVVPMFVNIFNDFGLVLPIPTRLVFLLSTWLTSGSEVIVTSTLAAALFGSILFWLTRRASKRLDIADILAKGKTSDLLAMSQLTKRLAQSLETESVGDSIRMAATGCINPRYQQPLEILAVEADSRLSTLHQSAGAIQFPENVIEALKLGGNTSSDRSNQPAIALLNTLSAMYEERALGRVAVGATLAGLVSTLFVGGIVAFIILSLFLPLMNLIAGLA